MSATVAFFSCSVKAIFGKLRVVAQCARKCLLLKYSFWNRVVQRKNALS